MTDKAPPEKAKPLGRRIGEGLRAAGASVQEPGTIPNRAEGAFRGWFRQVWDARGGGLYAVGFAVTFLYLETSEFITEDVPQLAGLSFTDVNSLLGFAIDFIVDTFMNTLAAFMWPVTVIGWQSPYGLIALIAAFVLFPHTLKPVIERWLFRDEEEAESDSEAG